MNQPGNQHPPRIDRDDWIRTSDLSAPNAPLFQTELHPGCITKSLRDDFTICDFKDQDEKAPGSVGCRGLFEERGRLYSWWPQAHPPGIMPTAPPANACWLFGWGSVLMTVRGI